MLAGKIVNNIHYKNIYQIFVESYAECSSETKCLYHVDDTSYSYSELHAKIDALSFSLNKMGLTKGSNVGLFLPNGLERVALILTLAKLGIIFFPLDAALDKKEVQYILSLCSPELVFIGNDEEYKKLWLQYGVIAKLCFLHNLQHDLSSNFEPEILEAVSHSDLFCILFTSGSTGVPKGVMLTHGNFINRFTWYWEQFPYNKKEVACSKSNPLYVNYVLETITPIVKCIPCVFMQTHHYKDLNLFTKYLEQYHVSRLYVVPSLLKYLVTLPEEIQLGLKMVFSSGELMPNNLAALFINKFPGTSLYNCFGTTEVPDGCVVKVIGDEISDASIVGYPIANTIVYVVNDDESLVTNSEEIGEIWLSGSTVSLGYINNSMETKKSYIKNPFMEDVPFVHVYKTGDYGKLTKNGIEYVGRNDNFVKIRGHKVNLQYVANVIKEIQPSAQVSVQAKFLHNKCQLQIYAFVASCVLTETDVSAQLRKQLPHYMMPKIVIIEKMPFAPASGKIDRDALYDNISNEIIYNDDYIDAYCEELSDIEKVRYATSNTLQIPAIDIDLNKSFFDLGGDSITVFLLLNELTKKFKLKYNLECILQAKSLHELINNSNVINVSCRQDDQIHILSFESLSRKEIAYIGAKFSDTFKTSDPLSIYLAQRGIHCNHFSDWVSDCKDNYPSYSFAAKINGKIVGAALNATLGSIEWTSSPPKVIVGLMDYCVDDVICRLNQEKHKIFCSELLYVDQDIPRDLGANVFFNLSNKSSSFGKSSGHTVSMSINTNFASKSLVKYVPGLILEKCVCPQKFCLNGEYPFKNMDEDYEMHVHLEYY